jgi:hypothetical protein
VPVAPLLASIALAAPENVDPVVLALSSRHPVPCAEVEALTPTPVDTLRHVVDTVSLPPWAPMRAADCLVRGHAAEMQPTIESWVTDPAVLGLGRLVLADLDVMPVEVAVPVARKALTGPLADVARSRIALSERAEVRAVGALE